MSSSVSVAKAQKALGAVAFELLELQERPAQLGAYIKALKENQIDEAITHHLEQIKDLHRNPLDITRGLHTLVDLHELDRRDGD